MTTKHNETLRVSSIESQGKVTNNPSQAIESKNDGVLLHLLKANIELYLKDSKIAEKDFLANSVNGHKKSVLLAVSGGIDSQVMLHSIFNLSLCYSLSLHVVTINHNLRESNESKLDADLVVQFCRDILNLTCKVITIEKGEVQRIAQSRNRGIEEAARFVRYLNIEKYAKEIHADVVFFAHNKDDQLETLLQRFLQGSSSGISGFSSCGISQLLVFPNILDNENNNNELMLFRPLLNVSRKEIEMYAKKNNIPFREDITNTQISYYRNRIRHKLVPVLNEYFSGWDTGILHGSEKALRGAQFLENIVEQCSWENFEGLRMKKDIFFSQGFPVRIRLLYKAIESLKLEKRVSYEVLKACADGQTRVEGFGLEFIVKSDYVVIRRQNKRHIVTENFDFLVTTEGVYTTTHAVFEVKAVVQKNQNFADTDSGCSYIGNFNVPFQIRSKLPGDKAITAQGTHKTVKKIFSEWRVEQYHRHLIPIIVCNNEIIGIWGSVFGYKNWYVKQKNNINKSVYICYKRNFDDKQ